MAANNLTSGDFVYHGNHGTGRYVGPKVIEGREFLEIEFAGDDRLFVPIASAGLIERVPSDGMVRIDRLRKGGAPPPPPRALIRDRASRSSGGPGMPEGDLPPDPLLEAAKLASPERKLAVARAAEAWTSRLIDLSRRNRLLFFTPLKVRTVEFSDLQLGRALPLIAGESVTAGRVFGQANLVKGDEESELVEEIEQIEETDLGVARRLQEIQKRGDEDFEERGLETVYFAYGMATWSPTDQGRPPEAPVIMVPIAVTGTLNRLALQPSGDLEINLALTHVLEEEYGCAGLTGDLEQLVADSDELAPDERALRIFEKIREAAATVPGFGIEPTAVIANFAFQKLAMVRDLQRWVDHMAGHDLIAAVAGDVASKRSMSERRTDVDPRDLDKRGPEQEFLVMDADSSQLRAIVGILQGQSGVIVGPPGTGKSQTIANLIGELIANGKRVLFVAEKRAALEVVKGRLTRRGLGDLVLDLHGALSRKQIMSQFSLALETVSETLRPRVGDLHAAFVNHRQRLNEYVERIHRRRDPTGYSAYELMGHLLTLRTGEVHSEVRWKGAALQKMTRETIRAIEEVLRRAASEPRLFLRTSPSPWVNAELRNREEVEDALELANGLATKLLPALQHETEALAAGVGLVGPTSVAAYAEVLGIIERANQILQTYRPEVFRTDTRLIAKRLEPAKSPLSAFWASLTNQEYRQANGYLGSFRHAKARSSELLADLSLIQRLLDDWTRIAPADVYPSAYPNHASLAAAVLGVQTAARGLGRYVTVPSDEVPMDGLTQLVDGLASDRQTPAKLPAVRGYEAELMNLGAGPVLQEIKQRSLEVDGWVALLRFAWLASCADQLLLEEPELAIFNGREHDKIVAEFKTLDRQRLEVADDRVRRAYAESVVSAANQFPDEHLLVKRQAALRSRHLPFRELARRAPHVVTAVKPCWMASPLAVSQLLGRPEQLFDVVIFDEASQVLPEDAVTSILRGKSVVVAGDPNQLPPSPFFAAEREEDESEPAEEMEGFESILDVMLAFLPQWSLNWHYRSHDERLIAFSNHYIYDDRLVTFPSPGGEAPAIRHVLVEQTLGGDSQELSSSGEVTRVVELILEHAQQRPDESLGVIAMGIKHSNRIQAELIRARRGRPELDGFFDSHPDETFFVKNLERVQGDERDSIILSIGYGKDSSGKLPYRFGPLLNEGGHRRLNVAVTRAKRRATLVSSFSHLDMDPSRSSKKGVELLRLYLEYAYSGGEVFGDGGPTTVERNEFEIQVQLALEHEGLLIEPQFGASRYRIDMVVQHPDQPGREVLAIECDGASYHSSPTARDRDRLRQEHLEARGWRFVRIWSTDWFTRPDEEVARVMEAYARGLETGSPVSGAEPVPAPQADPLPSIPSRDQRPAVPRQLPITEYSIRELASIALWLQSDGLLRTDDELVAAMMDDLGFHRRARRIEAALRQAIQLSKS